jgi:ATP-dependent exoDNAse (exonuclease V) alpha subunit
VESVYITASTGIAACNVGGTTLHSFAGVGVGKMEKEKLAEKVIKNKANKKKWMNAKVVVIDEISMVGGDFFEKVEYVARRVRNNEKPFGGSYSKKSSSISLSDSLLRRPSSVDVWGFLSVTSGEGVICVRDSSLSTCGW